MNKDSNLKRLVKNSVRHALNEVMDSKDFNDYSVYRSQKEWSDNIISMLEELMEEIDNHGTDTENEYQASECCRYLINYVQRKKKQSDKIYSYQESMYYDALERVRKIYERYFNRKAGPAKHLDELIYSHNTEEEGDEFVEYLKSLNDPWINAVIKREL